MEVRIKRTRVTVVKLKQTECLVKFSFFNNSVKQTFQLGLKILDFRIHLLMQEQG